MQAQIKTKAYNFMEEGFQTPETEGIITYQKIYFIKKDLTSGKYDIKYLNEKDKKRKTEIYIPKQHQEQIDIMIKTNNVSLISSKRNRSLLESSISWIQLFCAIALVPVVTIILMYSGESARLPIVIIPLVNLGFKLGFNNLILIIIGGVVIGICGTIFSFSRKKAVEIFTNKN